MINALLIAIDVQNFINSLPYVGLGMLGVFIVIGAIILIMTAMIKIENKVIQNKKNKEQDNN